jgi:hypothetical protein
MRFHDGRCAILIGLFVFMAGGCASLSVSPAERIAERTYPSIFQAWNPIEMADVPLETPSDRLRAAARHDLLWEEPVSQLGYEVDLVLGAVWDHEHAGLARGFTPGSRKQALANRHTLLAQNPHMCFLMEIRWKDAPGSYLPEDSDGWMRETDGSRKVGWIGGPEPYYYLDYHHEDFRARIAEQARAAVASGVYDGIMLDWWGSHGETEPDALDLLARIREAIGPEGLIVVNNDRLCPLPQSAPLINGAFMEMHQRWRSENKVERWQEICRQAQWFEAHLRAPVINCLEIQAGSSLDRRAGLALALIYTNGYYLFAKRDNSDPSADHLHEWFDLYDVDLGRPVDPPLDAQGEPPTGIVRRAYERGMVVYNPPVQESLILQFDEPLRRASTGEVANTFMLRKGDGDFFLEVSADEARSD